MPGHGRACGNYTSNLTVCRYILNFNIPEFVASKFDGFLINNVANFRASHLVRNNQCFKEKEQSNELYPSFVSTYSIFHWVHQHCTSAISSSTWKHHGYVTPYPRTALLWFSIDDGQYSTKIFLSVCLYNRHFMLRHVMYVKLQNKLVFGQSPNVGMWQVEKEEEKK